MSLKKHTMLDCLCKSQIIVSPNAITQHLIPSRSFLAHLFSAVSESVACPRPLINVAEWDVAKFGALKGKTASFLSSLSSSYLPSPPRSQLECHKLPLSLSTQGLNSGHLLSLRYPLTDLFGLFWATVSNAQALVLALHSRAHIHITLAPLSLII